MCPVCTVSVSQGGKHHVNVQECVSVHVLCVHAYVYMWTVEGSKIRCWDTLQEMSPPQITIYVELHASALAALNLYLLMGKRDDKNTYLMLVSLFFFLNQKQKQQLSENKNKNKPTLQSYCRIKRSHANKNT